MDNIRITLAEVKEYLRIDSEEEDGLLVTLLSASIEHCENFLYPAVLPSESLPMPIKQAVLILDWSRIFMNNEMAKKFPKSYMHFFRRIEVRNGKSMGNT